MTSDRFICVLYLLCTEFCFFCIFLFLVHDNSHFTALMASKHCVVCRCRCCICCRGCNVDKKPTIFSFGSHCNGPMHFILFDSATPTSRKRKKKKMKWIRFFFEYVFRRFSFLMEWHTQNYTKIHKFAICLLILTLSSLPILLLSSFFCSFFSHRRLCVCTMCVRCVYVSFFNRFSMCTSIEQKWKRQKEEKTTKMCLNGVQNSLR